MSEYLGFVGENPFFANNETDALKEFSNRAGCEVRKCVYPTEENRAYYISAQGDLFGFTRYESKHVFVGYTVTRNVQHRYSKESPGVFYQIKNYLSNKSTTRRAERLVYCTFVLGRWDEDIELCFKDRDPYNVCVENIAEYDKEHSLVWSQNMTKYMEVYEREFNPLVHFIGWFANISYDDAKDCVQDAFMWSTKAERYMPYNFIGFWTFWAKKNAIELYRRKDKLCAITDWDGYSGEAFMDVDVLGMIKNEKHREMVRMKSQGYLEREIAEKFGTTTRGVGSVMKAVFRRLRSSLKKDYKVLGLKPVTSNRGKIFT